MRILLSTLLLATACGGPPDAPAELSDLTRWLYQVAGDNDDEALAAGITALHAELSDYDLEADLDERSWIVPGLTRAYLGELVPPDGRNPEDALAVVVARASDYGAEDHARLQMEPDQRPSESSAKAYLRTFPDTSDPECFPARRCEAILSRNEVRRENLLMAVDLVIHKRFRWVDWGEGRRAIVGRAWFSDSFVSDGGGATLWQSYTLDVWIEIADGTVWRYQSGWSESDVGFDDPELVQATIRYGIDEVLRKNDEVIAASSQ